MFPISIHPLNSHGVEANILDARDRYFLVAEGSGAVRAKVLPPGLLRRSAPRPAHHHAETSASEMEMPRLAAYVIGWQHDVLCFALDGVLPSPIAAKPAQVHSQGPRPAREVRRKRVKRVRTPRGAGAPSPGTGLPSFPSVCLATADHQPSAAAHSAYIPSKWSHMNCAIMAGGIAANPPP